MQIIVCKLVHLLSATGNRATKPGALAGTTKMLRQAGRIMKLTAILILGACLQIHATGLGQGITLSVRDVPIEQVLKKIQQQTDYKFLYTSQLLVGTPKVTVVVKNARVEEVLNMLFKNEKLDYEVNERTVIIRPRLEEELVKGKVEPLVDIDIKGKVVDENGKPVAGVTVTVKGTKKVTTTDANGVFNIEAVDGSAVLSFTHVNMEPYELKVENKREILAALKTKVSQLDDVQIIAYGKTTKRLQTGNVATVKGDEIQKQPVGNPLLALEGRVPGLFITQANGIPGGGVTVRVQGTNSINSGNDPLYVIDGVPYTSQLLPTSNLILGSSGGPLVNGLSTMGNPLSYINPANIESIEVLKDADATAIYGSRAANGAILITTKKGKAGKTKVDFNVQNGWGKVTRNLNLLNTKQYIEMRKEAIGNDNASISPTDYDINGFWDTTRYTDWQKELIGKTSKYFDAQASVSGGLTNTTFLISAGYHKETTVFPGSFGDTKGSLLLNVSNTSSNRKFKIQLSGNYLVDNNHIPNYDLTSYAITLAPNAPSLYSSDGSLNWMLDSSGSSTWTNPLARLNEDYNNKTSNLIGSATVGYEIWNGLELRTSLGYNLIQTYETQTNPLIAVRPENRPTTLRSAFYGNNNVSSWIVEPQIEYKKAIGKGRLEVLIGSTLQQNNSRGQILIGTGHNSDEVLKSILAASSVTVSSDIALTYKYNAIYGRVNYNWDDKYIINLNVRRDGSSRFGANNQFHNFGSIAGAWIFSKEKYFQNNFHFLSFGKVKASYGTTGNDQIGDYSYLSTYAPVTNNVGVPYQGISALAPTGLPNPNLEWEETKKLQVGLDLGVLKDKILLTASFSTNRSYNQLLSYSLPISTGFSGMKQNFPATVQNNSWEFTLQTVNIKSQSFQWISNFNLTFPKNKLTAFPDLANSSYADILVIGEPVSLIKAFDFIGVDPSTGVYQFSDGNGGTTNTPDTNVNQTATVFINTVPKFYGGFENTFKYKGFQLDVLLQFVKQIGPSYYFGIYPGSLNANQPTWILDRWQKAGDIKPYQKYSSTYNDIWESQYSATLSDASYTDASYMRVKNVSLSWQVPSSWNKTIHLNQSQLYIRGQNLFTISNYKGLDPETLSSTSLPPLRVLTIGAIIGL